MGVVRRDLLGPTGAKRLADSESRLRLGTERDLRSFHVLSFLTGVDMATGISGGSYTCGVRSVERPSVVERKWL